MTTEKKFGVCHVCGCDDNHACDVGIEGACSWTDETHTLCSNPDCIEADAANNQ